MHHKTGPMQVADDALPKEAANGKPPSLWTLLSAKLFVVSCALCVSALIIKWIPLKQVP